VAAGRRRLFLNPSQIVVYGRRHRFGDRWVEAALAGWAVLAGRRRPPRMLFTRADLPAAAGEWPARRAAA